MRRGLRLLSQPRILGEQPLGLGTQQLDLWAHRMAWVVTVSAAAAVACFAAAASLASAAAARCSTATSLASASVACCCRCGMLASTVATAAVIRDCVLPPGSTPPTSWPGCSVLCAGGAMVRSTSPVGSLPPASCGTSLPSFDVLLPRRPVTRRASRRMNVSHGVALSVHTSATRSRRISPGYGVAVGYVVWVRSLSSGQAHAQHWHPASVHAVPRAGPETRRKAVCGVPALPQVRPSPAINLMYRRLRPTGMSAKHSFNPFPPRGFSPSVHRGRPAVESAPGVARTRPMAPRERDRGSIRKVATSGLGCRLGRPVCRGSMADALPQGMPSR
jgi:hypothetical protein